MPFYPPNFRPYPFHQYFPFNPYPFTYQQLNPFLFQQQLQKASPTQSIGFSGHLKNITGTIQHVKNGIAMVNQIQSMFSMFK